MGLIRRYQSKKFALMLKYAWNSEITYIGLSWIIISVFSVHAALTAMVYSNVFGSGLVAVRGSALTCAVVCALEKVGFYT